MVNAENDKTRQKYLDTLLKRNNHTRESPFIWGEKLNNFS